VKRVVWLLQLTIVAVLVFVATVVILSLLLDWLTHR